MAKYYTNKDDIGPADVLDSLDLASASSGTRGHAMVVFFGQFLNFSIQLVSTVLLARMLSPEDFGLVAMVAILVNFVAVFRDAGLAQATIYEKSITLSQVSSLFWAGIVVSAAAALMVVVLSPLLAHFFSEPRLLELSLLMAVPVMLSGFTVQHRALLQKSLRFKSIVIVDACSHLFAASVGLFSALLGAGYWSLAIVQVTIPALQILLLWSIVKWIPGGFTWSGELRKLLVFGGEITGSRILNYLSRNADNLLIGKFVGVESLGHYSRAYSLMMAPIRQFNAPITRMYLPILSGINENPDAFRTMYLQVVFWVSLLTIPPTVLMILEGDRIVLLLLGQQWGQAAEIFQILAIAALFQPLASLSGLIMTSLGQTSRMLKWSVFSSIFISSSFVVGLAHGALGVALAYAIATKIQQPILLWYSLRKSPIDILSYLKSAAMGMFLGATLFLLWGLNEFIA